MLAYCAINNERVKLNKTQIFRIFRISSSGYYAWLKKYLSQDEINKQNIIDDNEVKEKFKQIIAKVGHVPGKRTFKTHMFRTYGINISVKKCKRIMNEMNLIPNLPKKDAYKGQATHNHVCAACQNYVDQDFKVAPRTIILTDITYLYYGFDRKLCYLCCFKDAYTTEILGYSLSKKMNIELVKDAYEIMMKNHCSEIKKNNKVYIHSDQGSQYLSTTFKQILEDDNFIQSTSARGNSQDNAPMESFFGRMKTILIDLIALCPDFETTYKLVSGFINSYNNEQYQYNLAALTPREFYLYSTTGIYPLSSYFGIESDELNSIESLVESRLRFAKEKQDKIKLANKKKREEKALINDPIKIVVRDKRIILKQIAKYENTKLTIDNQLIKLYELLSEMDAAEEFISNSDETIQSLLTNPIKWRNYKELNYVNKMESFF